MNQQTPQNSQQKSTNSRVGERDKRAAIFLLLPLSLTNALLLVANYLTACRNRVRHVPAAFNSIAHSKNLVVLLNGAQKSQATYAQPAACNRAA